MIELPIVNLNERHFELEDGSRRVEIYGQPIYFHKNGEIKSVDTFALYKYAGEIKNGSEEFPVKVNGLRTQYVVGEDIVNVTINGLYVDDQLVQVPNVVTPVYTQTEIFYEEIFDGVDIRVEVSPYTTREYIIFKKNPLIGKPFDGQNICVKYDIEGYVKTKEPYAVDANDRSVPVYETDTEKGIPVKALYTYAYPIVLDPTISPNPSSDATLNMDEGVPSRTDSTTLTTSYTVTIDCSGFHYNYKRAYLRFDLSSLAGATINSATFNITKTGGGGLSNVNQVTTEYDPETANVTLVYEAANGILAGQISGTAGLKTVPGFGTYVNTHKGGFCDIGMTPQGNTTETYNSSEAASNKPYLSIDYTPGASTGTNMQINIGDVWKDVAEIQINIGDTWKTVQTGTQINIGDVWKSIF